MDTERKHGALQTLLQMEDLGEKKAAIYARLLLDAALAQGMEGVSLRHQTRKQALEMLLFGKPKIPPKNPLEKAKCKGQVRGEAE